MQIRGHAHQANELDGAWTRAAAVISMEKNDKTSISKDR